MSRLSSDLLRILVSRCSLKSVFALAATNRKISQTITEPKFNHLLQAHFLGKHGFIGEYDILVDDHIITADVTSDFACGAIITGEHIEPIWIIECYLPYGKYDGPELWYGWYRLSDGTFKRVLFRKRYWKNFHLHGEDLQYYPNGKVEIINRWKNGNRHGHQAVYAHTGHMLKSTTWQNGSRHGYQYKWSYSFSSNQVEYKIIHRRMWVGGIMEEDELSDKKKIRKKKARNVRDDEKQIGVPGPNRVSALQEEQQHKDAMYKKYGFCSDLALLHDRRKYTAYVYDALDQLHKLSGLSEKSNLLINNDE